MNEGHISLAEHERAFNTFRAEVPLSWLPSPCLLRMCGLREPQEFDARYISRLKWTQALTSFEDLSDVKPDIVLFNAVAASFRWELNCAWLVELRRRSLRLDRISYHQLLKSFRSWEMALSGAEKMNSQQLAIHKTRNTHILKTLASCNQWKRLVCTLGKVSQRVSQISCNVAMGSLSRALKWRSALELLHLCQEHLQPDAISYANAYANASCGLWPKALKLLRVLEEALLRATTLFYNRIAHVSMWLQTFLCFQLMEWSQIRPDSVTLNTCITRLATQRQWGASLDLCNRLQSDHTTGALLLTAINHWIEAIVLLTTLRSSYAPRPIPSAIPRAMADASWTMALQFLEKDLSSYSSYSAASSWHRSLFLIGLLPSMDLQQDSISMNACMSRGKWLVALDLLRFMQVAKLEHTISCQTSALSMCNWRTALSFFQSNEDQVDTKKFNALLNSFEKCSQWRTSLLFLDASLSIPSLPDIVSFNAALCALPKGSKRTPFFCLVGLSPAKVLVRRERFIMVYHSK